MIFRHKTDKKYFILFVFIKKGISLHSENDNKVVSRQFAHHADGTDETYLF